MTLRMLAAAAAFALACFTCIRPTESLEEPPTQCPDCEVCSALNACENVGCTNDYAALVSAVAGAVNADSAELICLCETTITLQDYIELGGTNIDVRCADKDCAVDCNGWGFSSANILLPAQAAFEGITFQNAGLQNYGAIEIHGGGELLVKDCTFTENTATAINALPGTTVDVRASKFVLNNSDPGVRFDRPSTSAATGPIEARLDGCTFFGNGAGAIVYALQAATSGSDSITVTSSQFAGNSINIQTADATVVTCSDEDNIFVGGDTNVVPSSLCDGATVVSS